MMSTQIETNNNQNEEIQKIDSSKELRMLNQGNTAEIYQYENHKIIKLFRQSMPLAIIKNEYQTAQIVQDEFGNVPAVFSLLEYKERYGIVYEQIAGSDMIHMMLKDIRKLTYYSRLFAALHVSMHKKDIDVHCSVKEKLSRDIDFAKGLSEEEKAKIKKYLDTLPEGNKICHFDYHPGNIMIMDEQPIVIDWMTACTGDPSADVARTVLLMQTGEMIHMNPLARVVSHLFTKRIGQEYLKEYTGITGVAKEDITRWMLPVAAARLAEFLTEHERSILLHIVREKLDHLSN